MKYRVSVLIVLMAVYTSCSLKRLDQAQQPAAQQSESGNTLALGMSHKAALELIRECGGRDVTSGMAIMGRNGESPPDGLFWSLEQYNSILEIGAENGNIVWIGYWTHEDFSRSKEHRAATTRSIKSLTFNRQAKTLQIQDL